MEIKTNAPLPAEIITALGLREGRAAFEAAMALSSGIVPVVIVAGGAGGDGGSSGSADLGFMSGAQAIVAGGVAQNVMLQLKNPATNPKAVQVTRAWMYATGASFVSLRRYDPDLAVLVGNGLNRRLGQPGSGAQIRTQNSIAIPGAAVELYSHPGGANVLADFTNVLNDSAIQLDPGQGVILTINAFNVAGVGAFNFREF